MTKDAKIAAWVVGVVIVYYVYSHYYSAN